MPRSRTPSLLLVTPYLADANNGNWRTAARWARLLAPDYRVIVQAATDTPTQGRAADAVALIALHARRSHAAVAAWRAAFPERPAIVALTGTDLYKDLPAGDAAAQSSLAHADALFVLQDDAPRTSPRRSASVPRWCSSRPARCAPGPASVPTVCTVYWLPTCATKRIRPPPSPRGARCPHRGASVTMIGAALDPALGCAARDLAAADSRVQWKGPRTHPWTRQAIKRAHLLVVPSRMEGGANVVVEAVTAGTAVLGCRMSG